MTALLGLIALAGYQNRDKIGDWINSHGSNNPQGTGQNYPQGGLGSVLGNLGGAGVGGLLNNGLRELLERFGQNGHGDVAQSWINRGPNREIAPNDLKSALGSDVLSDLSQRTGLSQEDVLARLSQQLPAAVDQYTPDGRIPA